MVGIVLQVTFIYNMYVARLPLSSCLHSWQSSRGNEVWMRGANHASSVCGTTSETRNASITTWEPLKRVSLRSRVRCCSAHGQWWNSLLERPLQFQCVDYRQQDIREGTGWSNWSVPSVAESPDYHMWILLVEFFHKGESVIYNNSYFRRNIQFIRLLIFPSFLQIYSGSYMERHRFESWTGGVVIKHTPIYLTVLLV